MNLARREFIKDIAVIGAGLPISSSLGLDFSTSEKKQYPVSFFTKPLDEFDLEFMSEALSMAGVDGFDLPLRPKGRVEPERVADELPKVVEMGKKYKLSTEMMVTAFTDVKDPFCDLVLKTASMVGVRHYRLGYYDFDLKEGIPKSLEKIKNRISQLAGLNKKYDIQGGYQNHSGTKVGAPLWDVWQLLQGLPLSSMSSQFDIRHAVTEGASSWILALNLLKNNIGSLAIKDFTWEIVNGKAKVVSVPLGEGIVDFENYFKTLKELNIVAPISLHIEYPFFSKEEQNLSLLQKQKIIVAKLKKDVDFVRMYLNKFQLV
jgi:sugar phosphate isomerase/epimerase